MDSKAFDGDSGSQRDDQIKQKKLILNIEKLVITRKVVDLKKKKQSKFKIKILSIFDIKWRFRRIRKNVSSKNKINYILCYKFMKYIYAKIFRHYPGMGCNSETSVYHFS